MLIKKKKLIFVPTNVQESNQSSSEIKPATFVTLSSSNDYLVAQSSDSGIICGIAQINTNNMSDTVINSGEPVGVWTNTQQALLRLGGVVSSGDQIRADVNGLGVQSTNGFYGAIAMQSGHIGDLISVIVQIGITPTSQIIDLIPLGGIYNAFRYNTRD